MPHEQLDWLITLSKESNNSSENFIEANIIDHSHFAQLVIIFLNDFSRRSGHSPMAAAQGLETRKETLAVAR
jgi:hypothetical protein